MILGMAIETGSLKLLFKNLDLSYIHSILSTDLHTKSPGRFVVYQTEWDLKVLMLRQLSWDGLIIIEIMVPYGFS